MNLDSRNSIYRNMLLSKPRTLTIAIGTSITINVAESIGTNLSTKKMASKVTPRSIDEPPNIVTMKLGNIFPNATTKRKIPHPIKINESIVLVLGCENAAAEKPWTNGEI